MTQLFHVALREDLYASRHRKRNRGVTAYSMGALPISNNRRIFIPHWRLGVLCNRWDFRLALSATVGLLLCIVAAAGMSLRHHSTPSCRVYDPAQGVGVLIDDAGRRLCRANG
jgi:hypothetical protein